MQVPSSARVVCQVPYLQNMIQTRAILAVYALSAKELEIISVYEIPTSLIMTTPELSGKIPYSSIHQSGQHKHLGAVYSSAHT